jgi:hypothetical protein
MARTLASEILELKLSSMQLANCRNVIAGKACIGDESGVAATPEILKQMIIQHIHGKFLETVAIVIRI